MVITDDPPKLPDEQALLVRARAGETEAFCRVISPLQTRLLRQAIALAGDVSTAEDLVSETLVEAWKSLPRYNQNCRFSTWLYSILLHRHWKSVRRARRRPVVLAWLSFFEARDLHQRQENVPSPEPSPAELMTENETTTRLRLCLERLPEPHRQVILLRFFEDASLTEIASVLGCSVGTVKSRLHHALEKLRQMKLNLPGPDGDKPV
ncbi:MAG: RNA polymerase sigma factor [Verrucomicrobiae bacterium]|nr:RNA polymerase sigma factor [Verrucomicrobiae bacterium]